MFIVDAPASRLGAGQATLPTPMARADAKAKSDARSIDANARAVVAAIVVARVVVVVVVVVAPEAAVVRPIAVVPPARSAVHLVDDVGVSDGALHGLRTGKPDGTGGLNEKSRRRQDGAARNDAKGFLHDTLSLVGR